MKALFLDIDGVINSEDYAVYRYLSKQFDTDEFIDERAVVFLNHIIEQTGAKVVLSSSWRADYEKTEERLKTAGFKFDLFDKTPYHYSRHRGTEIKMWIDKYEKEHGPLESYAIIDDDGDMLPEQKQNFVQCSANHGLTVQDAFETIGILNTLKNERD